MKARGKAASFAILLLAASLTGTGLVPTGIGTAEAAQAVATFRVGIRIVPASAPKTASGAALPVTEKTQAAAALSLLEERTIIVQPGETLSTIAARIYGDASRYVEIFEANRDVLTSPDLLPAGTHLRLP